MTRKHVYTYIFRGGKYAFTSACAILAGYLMQAKTIQWRELIVLTIPVTISVFFFICYANRFHSIELRDEGVDEVQAALQREAIWVFPGIALVIFLWIATTQSLSWKLLLAFGLYALIYVLYSWFFISHPVTESIPIIRHRLVWPVVLSIGISLYYGLSFSALSTSLKPLIPIGFILFLYFLSETFRLSKTKYVIVTLLFTMGFAIVTVVLKTNTLNLVDTNGLADFFSSMFFCGTVSAYLAVFEAWKVTSDIANDKHVIIHSADSVTGTTLPSRELSSSDKAKQYSMATLIALMISVWVMPFFFVFSKYGVFFLISFVFHAFFSFSFWYVFGRGEHLKNLNWGRIKNVSGLLFLAILVLVTFLDTKPSQHIFKGLASLDGLSLLAWGSTLTLATLYFDLRRAFRRRKRRGVWYKTLITEINVIRFWSVLCLFAAFILVRLASSYEEGSEEYYKAELAFTVYGICILICFVVVLLDSINIRPPMSAIGTTLYGFIILSRIVTSLLISMAVFIPSLKHGNSFYDSFLHSLPFFLTAVGGFALNDFYDVSKDKVNKPYRAIPSGKLSASFVLGLSLVLLLTASLLSVVLSRNATELALYALTLLGVSTYNYFVKYLSLSKTFLTSAVSALPLLYSVLIFDYLTIYLLLPLATSLFILGREWLMDVRDINGDSFGGITTIPMLMGRDLTAKLGFLLQILSAFVLLPIVVSSKSVLGWGLLFVIATSVALLIPLWFHKSGKYHQQVIRILWVPMLSGVLMLL